MKIRIDSWLLVPAVILLIGSAQAKADLVDDFNDGSTASWTAAAGTLSESGGFMSGSNVSLGIMDGQAGLQVGVDAVSAASGTNYVAIALNYTSASDVLFVKIQDNDSDGLFDSVWFYHGNNGRDGLVGGGRDDKFDLSFGVNSTFFEVTDHGDGTVTAFVEATGDVFGGTLNNNYTGTGVGLGFFGNGKADNFYIGGAAIPEPSSTLLLGLAALGLCASRSRRRKKAPESRSPGSPRQSLRSSGK